MLQACFADAWALEKYGRPFPSMGEVGEEEVSGPENRHEAHFESGMENSASSMSATCR